MQLYPGQKYEAFALTIILHQTERLCIPAVLHLSGLNIQVTVNTHRPLGRVRPQTAQEDGGERDLLTRRKLRE